MKKLFGIALLILPLASFALTCPLPSQVYKKQGDEYIPVAPAGWELRGNSNHLKSDDVTFALAAYGADLHPPTDKDNHVRCYYGDPILEPDLGVAMQTIAVIKEEDVRKHPGWSKNQHYYMCGHSQDVNECQFG